MIIYALMIPILSWNLYTIMIYFVRSPKAIVHTLAPREVLNYTWDDPEGKKMIRWNFPSAIKISNRKPIEIVKVS